ncbi:hypothetical protein FGG08_003632 [Glutinoglossum americanum]|uniref:Uncharacterized protein n=1 Tax=Glutinoglossum americanum TaxID=1670608 RepID=A0A9P8L0E7_9PEZI|nr:hypothetical protein FGG08_003632 [Glutinoglossum americanum]
MRILRRQFSPSTAVVVSVLALSLLVSSTLAQGPPSLSSSDAGAASTDSGSDNTQTVGSGKPSATDAPNTDSPPTSGTGKASATKTGTGKSATQGPPPPALTTSTSLGDGPSGLPSISNDLPTLPGGAAVSYPAPSVPPTANAPYMQHSNLPEGTVFIAVGAVLGFLGLAVLAWRGLVAWSLHRSVKRAAIQNNLADSKAMLRPPGGGFYANGAGSSLSLDHLSSSGKSPNGPRHTPNSSLFFSPTATTGAGLGQPNNRGSGYLPAGYYAAGNAAPGGGTGMTHIGGGAPISLSTHSHGYTRTRSVGPSPPGSPSLPPSRGGDAGTGFPRGSLRAGPSMTSLNLSTPQQERAPSAYLEDLFENHQPGQMPGGGNSRY